MGYKVTMPDEHWQESLSEETRQMILNTTMKAYGQFLDQLTAPRGTISKQAQYRQQLARRIKNIATDLSLEGRDADANVLYEVVDALGGAR
jgi:N-glycosylase/DNA lyase